MSNIARTFTVKCFWLSSRSGITWRWCNLSPENWSFPLYIRDLRPFTWWPLTFALDMCAAPLKIQRRAPGRKWSVRETERNAIKHRSYRSRERWAINSVGWKDECTGALSAKGLYTPLIQTWSWVGSIYGSGWVTTLQHVDSVTRFRVIMV